VFRDGVVVKTVVHRVVVFIDLMKRFCSFVFFVVFSRSSIGSKISSLYPSQISSSSIKLFVDGTHSELSLSLCVYTRARKGEKVVVVVAKRRH